LVAAAEGVDLIIIAEGINDDDESESMDRDLIDWVPGKVDVINQIATMGTPIILLSFGDQIDQTPFLNNPNISAIMWGGYPGMAGGDAVVNILTGKTAPAGRLPVTQYPGDYVNQVEMTDMNLRPNATSGNPGRTYKWYDNAVQPFGFGLHYTNFSTKVSSPTTSYDISKLISSCDRSQFQYLDMCPFNAFKVNVTNTGSVASDFVTLGFISTQAGPKPAPIKELVAYQRLFNVTGHSSQTATLNLTLGSLARRDVNGNQILYPGDYGLLIDVPTQAMFNFTLTGSEVTLDNWPQRPAQG
jgi:xylan 1,4-beta-xylosidase